MDRREVFLSCGFSMLIEFVRARNSVTMCLPAQDHRDAIAGKEKAARIARGGLDVSVVGSSADTVGSAARLPRVTLALLRTLRGSREVMDES